MYNPFNFSDPDILIRLQSLMIQHESTPTSCTNVSTRTHLKIVYIASTAFLRTYECRCFRHCRMAGIRGSTSSGSLSLHRNLRVEPWINSLGCCRSWKLVENTCKWISSIIMVHFLIIEILMITDTKFGKTLNSGALCNDITSEKLEKAPNQFLRKTIISI